MSDLADLERRIRTLEDLEAIKRLKYRYFRCLDLKLWDEMATCFAPDATVDYGGGAYRFTGVDAIMRFLRESLARETGALGYHHGHHPEIDLLDDSNARGVWALDNYLFNDPRRRGVRIAAYYRDEYVKRDGRWLIRHTGYTYVFHEEWSRADTPSIRLLAP